MNLNSMMENQGKGDLRQFCKIRLVEKRNEEESTMLNFTTEFAKFYTEQHKDLLTKSVNPFKSVKRIFPNGPRKLPR